MKTLFRKLIIINKQKKTACEISVICPEQFVHKLQFLQYGEYMAVCQVLWRIEHEECKMTV